MPAHTSTRLLTVITAWLLTRLTAWQARPEDGSHATEYAIGIGLSAAIALALWGAYQLGIDNVIDSWFFNGGNG
jgi:hypothetical protein